MILRMCQLGRDNTLHGGEIEIKKKREAGKWC